MFKLFNFFYKKKCSLYKQLGCKNCSGCKGGLYELERVLLEVIKTYGRESEKQIIIMLKGYFKVKTMNDNIKNYLEYNIFRLKEIKIIDIAKMIKSLRISKDNDLFILAEGVL